MTEQEARALRPGDHIHHTLAPRWAGTVTRITPHFIIIDFGDGVPTAFRPNAMLHLKRDPQGERK